MVTDWTLTNSRVRAHAVQKELTFPWNFSKFPNENECDSGGDLLGGVYNLGILEACWQIWNASFRHSGSCSSLSVQLFNSGVSCTGTVIEGEVDQALTHSGFTLLPTAASSPSKACVRSGISRPWFPFAGFQGERGEGSIFKNENL